MSVCKEKWVLQDSISSSFAITCINVYTCYIGSNEAGSGEQYRPQPVAQKTAVHSFRDTCLQQGFAGLNRSSRDLVPNPLLERSPLQGCPSQVVAEQGEKHT